MGDQTQGWRTADLTVWLEDNWDPDLTVAQWWDRLGRSGWGAPALPKSAYGLGLTPGDAAQIEHQIGTFGALAAPGGLGTLLAAPTIAAFGTSEQVERYVPDIVTGKKTWCQLFSEPAAGSDLAGLRTKATADGDEWVINGQKVWTSGAQVADYGMLLARTDGSLSKHGGLTYFVLEMRQPEVEVRPLREMTGRTMFNEVFLSGARVSQAAVIGGLNNGWAVANGTLNFERSGLSAGVGHAGSGRTAQAGSIAGELTARAGELTEDISARAPKPEGVVDLYATLVALSQSQGRSEDAIVRQDLSRLYTLREIGRMNAQRLKDWATRGTEIPGMPNIGKLSMSEITRLQRDLGLRLLGHSLHDYGSDGSYDWGPQRELAQQITDSALFAQAPSIYGGSDQVQRNIIGERVLGLPRESAPPSTTPFSELPENH